MAALILCSASSVTTVQRAAGSEVRDLARLERATSLFGVGLAAQQRGDLPAARDAYRAAIDSDPLLVEAMGNLALALAESGEASEAEQWLDRAESIRSEYPGVHAVRGMLALRAGNTGRALESLTRAAGLAPRDARIAANLGTALLRQGLLEHAIAQLRRALEIDPALPEAELNLAIAYDRAGELRDAMDRYRRFLEIAHPREELRSGVEQRIRRLRESVREASAESAARGSHTSTQGVQR
jgi:Tfp pilus assembly protein PilF